MLCVWHFNVLYIVAVDRFFPSLLKLASLFGFHKTEVTKLRCFLYVSLLKSLGSDTSMWKRLSRFVITFQILIVTQ